MLTNNKLDQFIYSFVDKLKNTQKSDGSWKYCFEGGLMTDAFMIITLRALDIKNEESLIKNLTERLLLTQTKEGTWKAYPDEEGGNLSVSIQAYCALLFSGFLSQDHPALKKAEHFIKEKGGLHNAHFMTKWMLAVNGLYPWPTLFYVPMTFLLIPERFPFNFYQFSAYARIHFIPMMVAANKKFTLKSAYTPVLSHLYRQPSPQHLLNLYRSHSLFMNDMKKLLTLPEYLHRLGYQRAERYMLKRIEEDGTLYSYASATFFMIFALLSLGYNKNSPTIVNAINGLKQLVSTSCNGIHLENSTSTVWDTALLSYALQEAKVANQEKIIQQATSFLLSKQHTKKGDWKIHNPNVAPGGWGFSHNNTMIPDNDDTSAVLRAISRTAILIDKVRNAWYRGVTYLLSMQNADGGWGAFEKNTDLELLTLIPLENAKDAAIDPSTPDLTGRTLEFLGTYAGLSKQHPSIKAAIQWLENNQERNGSWYGRWGVCYIYGTWAAVTGMISVGVSVHSPVIQKAIHWLESVQLDTGGWGESCISSIQKKYTPLLYSTPSQTSWALDALIQSNAHKNESVQKGISHLLDPSSFSQSALTYPTGIGLPGQFYIHYHSYNDIFPLLALAHYRKKIITNSNVSS
ncbi:squalene--hopene cyclase [Metabacillus halosaccharovorans]|uniref:Squalene--hopene cyclase n=1 Tax=Metabacillus halosaccharovorans TaxID=930124 RepID=A0ABT3DG26_9BACI|nr:squalene--hopene cyclase [Metabacillus halosaccharovorans]MCV9886025.1 squalene--hopene cyclase [Metabacillus halosaccharovorans]